MPARRLTVPASAYLVVFVVMVTVAVIPATRTGASPVVQNPDEPAGACIIDPGIDLFQTPCGGATYQDFSANPIPPGFFGPGSDPFTGVIQFQGNPIAPLSPLGSTDTIVERLAPAFLPGPGGIDIVPIEIVALNLVSVNPIIVTYGGGGSPERWNVQAVLSHVAPQQPGQMRITASICGCAEGGTFDSFLPVLPRLIFRRLPPHPPGVRDANPVPPIQFTTSNGHWTPFDPGFGVFTAPPGMVVDDDSDPGTPPTGPLPPSSNFFPGLRLYHCDPADCLSPPRRAKRMTREQAMLAEHGVLPPEPCLGDTDSDCICNEADNCVFTFNPRQIDSDDDGIGDDCDIDPTIYKPCQPTASVGQLPRPGATGGSLLLGAPMPNPAIDEIAFFVEVAVESHVKIEMFDLHGRTVGIVLDRALAPGRHDVRWALREAGGGALASGVYFLRAQGAGASEIRKFTLLR